MALDDTDKELLKDYINRLLEHITKTEEIHPDVAAGLVRVHIGLIENSYEQCFPVEFCAERLDIANWKNANKDGPTVGFYWDLREKPEDDDGDDADESDPKR
jgi:hypothetical protein